MTRNPEQNSTVFFDIQKLDASQGEQEKIHSNNQFELIWILKGSCHHSIDMQITEAGNNRLLFIRPGQMHQCWLSEQTEGYSISFSASFLDIEEQRSSITYINSLFSIFSRPDGITIHESLRPEVVDIMEKLTRELNNAHVFRIELLRYYFKIFLIHLTTQFETELQVTAQTRNIQLVQHFMALLETRFKTHKMVTDYADELRVTPNYLNEVIKKSTGSTAGQHIRNRIVMEAKRMGRYSDKCMKEIAYTLGFSESAHFSKFFKAVSGKNFTDFRKEIHVARKNSPGY